MSGTTADGADILGNIMALAWARRLLRTLRDPSSRAATYTYRSDLSALRAVVREHALRAGLPPPRVGDLVLAVSEVAANTLRYTRSPGTLAIWHDADEVVCEMHDEGVIADPLAGRRPPPPGALSGHGLWLVHQVCDRVELRSGTSGTMVRMRMAVHGQ